MSSKKRASEDEEEAVSILESMRANVGLAADALGAGAGVDLGTIDFIISAHGCTNTEKESKIRVIPAKIHIFSFTDLRSASSITCSDKNESEKGYLDGVCKTSISSPKMFHYQYPNVIYDIQYSHEEKNFESGVYDCMEKKFLDISSIEDDWTLSNVLQFLSETYPGKKINIYNLSCTISQKCDFKRTKYTQISHKNVEATATIDSAYDLTRKELERGELPSIASVLNIIPFFLHYYSTMIQTKAYTTNKKLVSTICSTINLYVIKRAFAIKDIDTHPLTEDEKYMDATPIDLPGVNSLKYELIRTCGILTILSLRSKISDDRQKIINLANKLVGNSLEDLSHYVKNNSGLSEIQRDTTTRLLYYIKIIGLSNILSKAFEDLNDIAKKLQGLAHVMGSSISSGILTHDRITMYSLGKKTTEELYKQVVDKSNTIKKLLGTPDIDEEVEALEQLQDELEDLNEFLLPSILQQYEKLRKLGPSPVGATRRQLRPVKKRTKTVRRRNK
jgi:hypothetical protein